VPAVDLPEIEFWFDFGSTYSYPAAVNIEKLAEVHGLAVKWRAFVLGAIFQEQGWPDSPFNIYPLKGRYMWRDMERICQTQDLDFNRPTTFPRNGLLAARVTSAAEGAPWLGSFVRQIFTANFVLDLDIADIDVVRSCLEVLDLDPNPILDAAAAKENKDALRTQTDRAKQLGIFGAPTFISNDEIFWGNDRLGQAITWAKRDA
jgi:2-hydroxychromene-2-carboxylate isomerase